MRTKLGLVRLCAVTCALFLTWCVTAVGVSQVPSLPSTRVTELESVFRRGVELEQECRWGEAVAHYEEAIIEHPEQLDLSQRAASARVHFDISRRYADSSYLEALATTDAQSALNLYAEVLNKIETHYVTSPHWHGLTERGVINLEVAVSDVMFSKRHLMGVREDQIADVRAELHSSLDRDTIASRRAAINFVSWAANYVNRHLQVAPEATIFEFTCAAVGSLDNYSAYLTSDQLGDVFSQIEGNFVGLGVELKSSDNSLLIVNSIRGGPAHAAGIRKGDRIISVDGKTMQDVTTDRAADLLKGAEGMPVYVRVLAPDQTVRDLKLIRRRVEVPSVEDVKMLQPGVGYLNLTSFQKTSAREVDTALWELHRQGMRSLVLDLRGNPGGLLPAAVDIADKFVSSGTIVTTRGRSVQENAQYRAHTVGTWRVPLIVLIDRDSASASEILAAAIGDHQRGTVVGEKSYGKGSVQAIFRLNALDAGIRFTTAKFYSPKGTAISKRGVVPDIAVRRAAKPVFDAAGIAAESGDHDPILKAAVQVAHQQLSQR